VLALKARIHFVRVRLDNGCLSCSFVYRRCSYRFGQCLGLWRCLIEVGSIATGIKIDGHNLLTSLFHNKSMSREINLYFF